MSRRLVSQTLATPSCHHFVVDDLRRAWAVSIVLLVAFAGAFVKVKRIEYLVHGFSFSAPGALGLEYFLKPDVAGKLSPSLTIAGIADYH